MGPREVILGNPVGKKVSQNHRFHVKQLKDFDGDPERSFWQMAPGAKKVSQIIVSITRQLKEFDGPREVIWGRWPLAPPQSVQHHTTLKTT